MRELLISHIGMKLRKYKEFENIMFFAKDIVRAEKSALLL